MEQNKQPLFSGIKEYRQTQEREFRDLGQRLAVDIEAVFSLEASNEQMCKGVIKSIGIAALKFQGTVGIQLELQTGRFTTTFAIPINNQTSKGLTIVQGGVHFAEITVPFTKFSKDTEKGLKHVVNHYFSGDYEAILEVFFSLKKALA